MTRIEYRNYVIAKLREDASDPAVTSMVDQFTDQRYRMIWSVAEWQDAYKIVSSTATVADMILPEMIERVQAVRCNGQKLNFVLPVTQMEFDPTFFDSPAAGQPRQFRNATQVATDVMTDGGRVQINSDQMGDEGLSVFIRGEKSNAVVFETIKLNITNSSTQVASVNSYDYIYQAGKPATKGNIVFRQVSNNALLGQMAALSTTKQNTRIVLTSAPDPLNSAYPFPMLTCCRMKCPGLVNDYDSPILRDVEFCLIEFVMADMLESQRQYGKAGAKLAIANTLLDALKTSEQNIGAYLARIIPEADNVAVRGMGYDWQNTIP